MWTTVYEALDPSGSHAFEPGTPPAHCPHPEDCLRMPLREPRSFCDGSGAERSGLDRYRHIMAQQCACNGRRAD